MENLHASENKEKIFVYGTLRVGKGMHPLLKGSYVLEKNRRISGYRMYSCGEFPTVVPTQQGGFSVEGDIILVNSRILEKLDRYEELEVGEYDRIKDKNHDVWIYVAGPAVEKNQTFFPIDMGVWT